MRESRQLTQFDLFEDLAHHDEALVVIYKLAEVFGQRLYQFQRDHPTLPLEQLDNQLVHALVAADGH